MNSSEIRLFKRPFDRSLVQWNILDVCVKLSSIYSVQRTHLSDGILVWVWIRKMYRMHIPIHSDILHTHIHTHRLCIKSMRLKMQRNETRHNRDSPFFAAALFVRRCNFFLSLNVLFTWISLCLFLSLSLFTHCNSIYWPLCVKFISKECKRNEMKYNKELHWTKRRKKRTIRNCLFEQKKFYGISSKLNWRHRNAERLTIATPSVRNISMRIVFNGGSILQSPFRRNRKQRHEIW